MRCPWCRLVHAILDHGVHDLEMTPRDGVNPEEVWQSVRTVLDDPKIGKGRKIAGAAALLNEGLLDASWVVNDQIGRQKLGLRGIPRN